MKTLIPAITLVFLLIVSGSARSEDILSPEGRNERVLYSLSETVSSMLLATRNVIAINQDTINFCPSCKKTRIKGLFPAVIGAQICQYVSATTKIKMRQIALRLRNPKNSPDEWERRVLEGLQAGGKARIERGVSEVVEVNGVRLFRYMRPLYVDKVCLTCHGNKEDMDKEVRKFIEAQYPGDQALGYREGDLRGGISVIIPVE